MVAALKAMDRGEATAEQQRLIMDWLIKEASGLGSISYRPDPYATAFAEGRRFVGAQIVGFLAIDLQKMTKRPREQGAG